MLVQRVLIPTDFSEKSHLALRSANIFIDLFGCNVDLMHVIPLSRYLGESLKNIGIPLDMDEEVYPKIIEKNREKLEQFSVDHIEKKEYRGKSFITIDRKPSDSILEKVKEGGYDMIIMSAKGGHNSDFFHGSTTHKIIRRSPVPVLTLSSDFNREEIKNIVVPCDFSEHSMKAVIYAYELARVLGAEVTLFHAVELYAADFHEAEPQIDAINEDSVYDSLINRLSSFLEKEKGGNYTVKRGDELYEDEIIQVEGDNIKSVPLHTVIRKSLAAHHEVIEYANKHGDMLIMSTHGRTGLSRMLLGSTTEQVIQHVGKPQITIKPDLEE